MSERMAHVIDDNDDARRSLALLLSTSGIPAQTYASASAFLAVASEAKGVVVIDLREPQTDGLDLIRRLKAQGITLSVIVLIDHGLVPLAVEAMRAGVRALIERPADDVVLLDAIRAALAELDKSDCEESHRREIQRRVASLSPRERQVLDGLVAGWPHKLIAENLNLSIRTVEVYRATMVTKMQARSLPELVRMALLAGVAF
jgi:two-component system response regulator FixJ